MPEDEAGEKTEQPTPRRREEARRKGQVPRSTDLTAATVILVGLLLLNVMGGGMLEQLLTITRLGLAAEDARAGETVVLLRRVGLAALLAVGPFLGVLYVLSLTGAIAQSGVVLAWSKLKPNVENLHPKKGLKRIFSTDGLARTGFGLLKMLLIGSVAVVSIGDRLGQLLSVAGVDVRALMVLVWELTFTLALRMALVLLLLGLVDYIYQRYKLEQSLKMTKQEVRDELKRMEGDPQLKARRRRLAQDVLRQRLAVDVPRADVVVTNPTEYAVAIRYDEAAMSAPRVVAKGKDFLALRIRQIAQRSGVPIVQRPPLARGLYAGVEVGGEIPPMFYRAVAELLAYVYRITGKATA